MKGRGPYTREFKLEAVRLLQRGEKPAAQLAMELGVKRSLLYRWREDVAARGDAAFSGKTGPKPSGASTEIAQLKRELAAVQAERDILKKAATYFAKALP